MTNQLKARNPQAFQKFEMLKNSGSNPQEFLNQIIGNYSPEQLQKFSTFAHQFGINDEQLAKYGIKK